MNGTDRDLRAQHVEIDGIALVGFADLVARVAAAYPAVERGLVESIALREYEAFTGGIPLAVPAALEEGLHEVLGATSAGEDAA